MAAARKWWRRLEVVVRRRPGPAANRQAALLPAASQARALARILILEPNGWTDSLVRLLEESGYRTQVAGRACALALLADGRWDLIIVGGRADFDLYRALRQATRSPILALVPDLDREQAVPALGAGVDHFQAGSISDGELLARIRSLLRRSIR